MGDLARGRHRLQAYAEAGERDLPARRAAQAAYRERHPRITVAEARETVALMIAAVARDHPTWLWNGVGAVKPLPGAMR